MKSWDIKKWRALKFWMRTVVQCSSNFDFPTHLQLITFKLLKSRFLPNFWKTLIQLTWATNDQKVKLGHKILTNVLYVVSYFPHTLPPWVPWWSEILLQVDEVVAPVREVEMSWEPTRPCLKTYQLQVHHTILVTALLPWPQSTVCFIPSQELLFFRSTLCHFEV